MVGRAVSGGQEIDKVEDGRGAALTVWELIGSVDVVGAHDDGLDGVAVPECGHEHFGGCLAAAVGIHGLQGFFFAMAVGSGVGGAVCLVGRHLDELLDAACFGALEEDLRAYDVGGGKGCGVFEARVDVGLGGEVDDGVDIVAVEAACDVVCGGDVASVEREILAAVEHFGVVQCGAIIELVKGDEVVMVLIGDSEGSNEPRTSEGSLLAFGISLYERV